MAPSSKTQTSKEPDAIVEQTTQASAPESQDEETPGVIVIELADTVDLPKAGDLYEQLVTCEGQPVAVCAEQVQFFGAPAFQVLLAAAASWQKAGTPFELRDASPGFLACCDRLGIDPALFSQGNPA